MDLLRLLVTSDTHGGVSWGSLGECALPRLATGLRAARQGRNALLLDNGDTFFGGPLVDHLTGVAPEQHSVARYFERLQFSAINVGNEDLRLGVPRLRDLARVHSLPLISTNLDPSCGLPTSRIVPVASCSGAEIKVGIVGTVPPSACALSEVDRPYPSRDCLEREIAHLKDAGCAAIIALCHSGIDASSAFPREEREAMSLAEIPGVTVVIAGHLHEVAVAHTKVGVPVIAPGSFGRHFGSIDLAFHRTASGRVRASFERISIESTTDVPLADDVQDLVHPDVQSLAAKNETALGVRSDVLTTDFAPVAKPSAVRWIEACLRATARAVCKHDDLIVASQCSGGRGLPAWTTIGPGDVLRRHIMQLFPYHNSLRLVETDGATLIDLLENSLSIFRSVDASSDAWQPLLNDNIPLCDHDYFSEVTHTIDLREPEGRRIRDARWRNRPIEPSHTYNLVLNSYRAGRLATRFPLHDRGELAPCVLTILERQVDLAVPADGLWQRRWLRMDPRPKLYFVAHSAARRPWPGEFRALDDNHFARSSGAAYAFESIGEDS